ncbi:F-box/TPR repeat protein Pof3 [Microdochium nivale]|nr:F-box/TPR repeat protein Pof3 [Microdochium nivale]
MATINYLANEVLELITQNLECLDLARLCLVSKRLDHVARPRLWQSVKLDPWQRQPARLSIVNTLLRNPALGLFTRELELKDLRRQYWEEERHKFTYPVVDFTADDVRQWLAKTYSPAFEKWMCEVAPKPESSRSHTLAFLAVYMPRLESMAYKLPDSDGLLGKLFKICKALDISEKLAATSITLPLAKLKSLELSHVSHWDPLVVKGDFTSIAAHPGLRTLKIMAPDVMSFQTARSHDSPVEKLEIHYAPLDVDTIGDALAAFPRLTWLNFCTCGQGFAVHGAMDLDRLGSILRELGQNLTMLNLTITSPNNVLGDNIYGRIGSLCTLKSLRNLIIICAQWLGNIIHVGGSVAEFLPASIQTVALDDSFDEWEDFSGRSSSYAAVQNLLAHHEALPELFCVTMNWSPRRKIKSPGWDVVVDDYGMGMAFVLHGTSETQLIGLDGNKMLRKLSKLVRLARQRQQESKTLE